MLDWRKGIQWEAAQSLPLRCSQNANSHVFTSEKTDLQILVFGGFLTQSELTT